MVYTTQRYICRYRACKKINVEREKTFANIFDRLNKFTDEELRKQIAMMQTFNVGNISAENGQKIARGSVKTANYFMRLAKKKKQEIEEPTVRTLEDRLKENDDVLMCLKREELDIKMRNLLIQRCNSLSVRALSNDDSQDTISIQIIEEVAKHYKLEQCLTPSQKADGIQQRCIVKLKNN